MLKRRFLNRLLRYKNKQSAPIPAFMEIETSAIMMLSSNPALGVFSVRDGISRCLAQFSGIILKSKGDFYREFKALILLPVKVSDLVIMGCGNGDILPLPAELSSVPAPDKAAQEGAGALNFTL